MDNSASTIVQEILRDRESDGAAATPRVEVTYFDPRTRTYKRAATGATPLKYHPAE